MIRDLLFWFPEFPLDDYECEVFRDGEWISRSTVYIGNEVGKFWHNEESPGLWKWQGTIVRAESAMDALHYFISLVERVEREGRI